MNLYRHARPLHRMVRRTAATRPMAKLFGVVQQPLDRLAYRLTGGTTTVSSWLAGVEITMLTTTGARSGRARTLPVLALPDGAERDRCYRLGEEVYPGFTHYGPVGGQPADSRAEAQGVLAGPQAGCLTKVTV